MLCPRGRGVCSRSGGHTCLRLSAATVRAGAAAPLLDYVEGLRTMPAIGHSRAAPNLPPRSTQFGGRLPVRLHSVAMWAVQLPVSCCDVGK
jgi:hypothetical protein